MKQKIISLLRKIEQDNDIKILYALESGSRGWGFESKNSDWDVRIIYIHNLDWYLSIEPKRDSFELITNDDIDISGWDLKKTLNLFKKSNPVLLEWLRSPIIYIEKYDLAKKLRNFSKEYFNPRSCLFHYYHMAQGNYEK